MPAGRSRVPKYCHFKPRDLAYVRVRGRIRYLGKYGTRASKEAYARTLAEMEVAPAVIRASPADLSALTIVELCAAYLHHAEAYYVKDGRPTDQMGTVRRTIRVLRDLYGETRAADFGPLALRAIQEHLVKNPFVHPISKRCSSYSRSTINSTSGCIKRVFKWAVSRELVPVAVHQALTTVPGLKRGRTEAREPKPIAPVPDETVERTLPFLSPVLADMVRFQRLTGARPGEVCQLRPMDLDRTGRVWRYRPGSHKTEHHGRERVLFIGPKAQAILLPYLLRPIDVCCFSPAESETKRHAEMRARRKSPVQPSQQNRRKRRPKVAPSMAYDKNTYRRAIARAIVVANQKDQKEAAENGTEPRPILAWFPNQLRHSAATEIRRQFGLEAAQTVLGHAKADVTQVYAERDHALAADVMAKIG